MRAHTEKEKAMIGITMGPGLRDPEAKWLFGFQQLKSKIFIQRSCQVTPLFSVPQKKAMALHSSTLAWKIPWTEEPGRL